MSNSNRGGSRKNAGRKKKGETVVLPFRVPASRATILKLKIKKIIKDSNNDTV